MENLSTSSPVACCWSARWSPCWSVRLIRGIRVNFSKSGASLSVGRRGATVHFGKRGVRTTVGLPGSGLSYSETKPWSARDGHQGGLPPLRPLAQPAPRRHGLLIGVLALVALAALLFATR